MSVKTRYTDTSGMATAAALVPPRAAMGCRRVEMYFCHLTRGTDIDLESLVDVHPHCDIPADCVVAPEPFGRVAAWMTVLDCPATLAHSVLMRSGGH